MENRNAKSRVIWSKGMMAVLLSAFIFISSTSLQQETTVGRTAFAESHDKMSDDRMISESGSTMMMVEKEEKQKIIKTNVPVTLPLTRGFVDGHEVFYISTEASDKDLADHLTNVTGSRVVYTPALANAPAESLANIYAFSNGIEGSGPLGFQASIAGSDVGDAGYSPMWRITGTTWSDPSKAEFLTSAQQISSAVSGGMLTTEVAGVVVNCPFVEV